MGGGWAIGFLGPSATAGIALLAAACASGGGAEPQARPPAVYRIYVAAESADLIHRLRFSGGVLEVERTIPVGESANETEGPHGLNRSPDGDFVYLTTGHGVPDGKLWKYDAGPDTLVAPGVPLGFFPATLDVTPDGLYAFVANFNLHGGPVASSVSVVFTPDMVEVERVETCVMPHGARLTRDGSALYSGCMMDDQIVELETQTFTVARRLSVSVGGERPHDGAGHGEAPPPSCSPTWVVPSPDDARLYVACNRAARILEIDRLGWRVLRAFETGQGPYNLAVTPDGRTLVATLKSAAGVQFFDLESGLARGTAPSSTTLPHGVVVSPDGRYAFVSVEGVGAEPGKVDVFDLESYERVAEAEVGQQAGGIVFWTMEP